MNVPLFDNGNPEWPFDGGTRMYCVDETHAWRKTTYEDGKVEIHRLPAEVVDVANGYLWEPWNFPAPESIPEDAWEEIRTTHGVAVRPLRAEEMISFGDLVQITPPPDFRAEQVVHGRRVLPSEAARKMFWRAI